MELRQLRTFYMIASVGSFTEAAKRLRVSQSALSHQISSMEEEFGCSLLLRTKPKVRPTPLGRTLLNPIKRILAEMEHLEHQLGLPPSESAGQPIRVAASALGIAYLYGDYCQQFILKHPNEDLSFTATETTEDAVRKVTAAEADIAFVPLSERMNQVATLPLGTAEQILIVGANHKLANQTLVSIEELQQFPFLRYQVGSGTRALTDELFIRQRGYPPVLIESNDTEFLKRLVAMGAGVCLVPIFTAMEELRRGTLRPLTLSSGRLFVPYGIIHHREPLSPAIQRFLSVCVRRRGPKPITNSLDSVGIGHPRPEPKGARKRQSVLPTCRRSAGKNLDEKVPTRTRTKKH
jgi:LysR family transcriptional regulator, low CO2-responsive transcriptional regulator